MLAAVAFAAKVARGRVLWPEVFLALYFIVAWRMAWAVWKRTVGRIGEPLRRWGRQVRRQAAGAGRIADPVRRRAAGLALLVSPTRFGLVVLVFAPLLLGSLVHRVKIGNASDMGGYDALPIETVAFETADGLTLSGWFLPDGASDATVVICHGAGANKGNFADFLSVLHGRGYNGLIFDFRGHGDSDGHTSTFGLFEAADVKAAVDWLRAERPERSRHVFALGSSMGAMALVRAAAQDSRIEAVVLDSCYVSAPLLVRQHLGRIPVLGKVVGNLVLASFSLHAGHSMWELDARAALAAISPRPVLIIHGRDDFVIPPVNMEMLYELADEPKGKWLGPGPHSNIMTTAFYEYQKRVIEFLDRARYGARPPSER